MRYTAAALTEASGPVPFRIGPSDHRLTATRPLGWRLRRAWYRRARTWVPLAISTPQMLALQAAHARSLADYAVELAIVLRAVLPTRWWYRVVGDPVAMVVALGRRAPDLQAAVLASLMRAPGSGEDESRRVDDPVEALRRAQRLAVYGRAEAPGRASLALAALTVRAIYGDAWYFNPARWRTSDGYAPFAVCLVEYAGVQAMDARRRLEVADGFAIAHAKDVKAVRARLERLAYPVDLVS